MRERIAAARMISTLVSRPCWCSGQGPLQYNNQRFEPKRVSFIENDYKRCQFDPIDHISGILCCRCSVCIVILRFSESAHFKTVPCSLKQKTRSTRPAIWGIAATGIPSPIPAIMNIKAESLPHASMCQCPTQSRGIRPDWSHRPCPLQLVCWDLRCGCRLRSLQTENIQRKKIMHC